MRTFALRLNGATDLGLGRHTLEVLTKEKTIVNTLQRCQLTYNQISSSLLGLQFLKRS